MKRMQKGAVVAALSALALGSGSGARAQERVVPRLPIGRVPIINLPEVGTTVFNPTLAGQARTRFPINANLKIKSPSILRARVSQEQLNQEVTVRGFYYEGSVPMVVDDIERTQIDMAMPPESYVPLTSRIASLQNGDEVEIKGRLVTPPARLFEEPSALQVAGDVSVRRITAANPKWRQLALDPKLKFALIPNDGVQTKYAVLVVGGINPSNNHLRYWNDLKVMYGILRNRGFKASNITVLYADGNGKDNSVPVNFSATKAHINSVFASLGDKLDAGDDLYVMLNDHGGGFLAQEIGGYGPGSYGAVLDPTNTVGLGFSEATYGADYNGDGDKNDIVHFRSVLCLWGENMTDAEFKSALDQVKFVKRTVVQMKQCFSGGFAQALPGNKRVVMSSAGPNQVSWAHSSGNYGAFTYAYFTALMGQKPDGGNVNTDPNGDGMVSLVEAWNYARTNNTAASSETSLYTDTPGEPASSAMPGSGLGTFGASFSP